MLKQLLSLLILTILLASCEFLQATDNGGNRKDQNNPRDPRRDDPAITVEDMPQFLNSQMFRAQGTNIYKHSQVTEFFQNRDEAPLPNTLFPIPRKSQDMDQLTSRPNDPNNCGYDFDAGVEPTISMRIADCRDKNPDNVKAHFWSGKNNGLSGEGDWRLVAHKGERSVWLDVSTGLIWSPPTVERSWEFASGSGVAEVDRICNGANDIANETDFFLGITPEEVAWRLPTRNDYLQADINGSRYVLSIIGDSQIYWTANYITESQQAWAIQQNTGILSRQAETHSLRVRCVGNVLK